MSFESQYAIFY